MNHDASAIRSLKGDGLHTDLVHQTSVTGFCDSASWRGPAPFSALLPYLRPLLHWGRGVCGIWGLSLPRPQVLLCSSKGLLSIAILSQLVPLQAALNLSRPTSETQSGPAALLAGLGFTCTPHPGTSCVTPSQVLAGGGEWPLRVGPLTWFSTASVPRKGEKQCSPPVLEREGAPASL